MKVLLVFIILNFLSVNVFGKSDFTASDERKAYKKCYDKYNPIQYGTPTKKNNAHADVKNCVKEAKRLASNPPPAKTEAEIEAEKNAARVARCSKDSTGEDCTKADGSKDEAAGAGDAQTSEEIQAKIDEAKCLNAGKDPGCDVEKLNEDEGGVASEEDPDNEALAACKGKDNAVEINACAGVEYLKKGVKAALNPTNKNPQGSIPTKTQTGTMSNAEDSSVKLTELNRTITTLQLSADTQLNLIKINKSQGVSANYKQLKQGCGRVAGSIKPFLVRFKKRKEPLSVSLQSLNLNFQTLSEWCGINGEKECSENVFKSSEKFEIASAKLAENYKKLKASYYSTKSCENNVKGFLAKLWGKCKDNGVKCGVITGGAVVGTALIIKAVNNKKDEDDKKDAEDDAYNAMVAKNTYSKEITDNCTSDMNYTSDICTEPLVAYCSEDSEQANCGQFAEYYCGATGTEDTPGKDSEFCNEARDQIYCEDTNNAGSPTCLERSIADNPLCKADASKCTPPGDMATLCAQYTGDPKCTAVVQAQVAADLQNNSATTGSVTNTGSVTATSSSGYSQQFSTSSTGHRDIASAYAGDAFSAMSAYAQSECNSGAMAGCYQKTGSAGNK